MLRRVVAITFTAALLGAGLAGPADASAGTQPWRVSTRCTQDGVFKVRLDHDLNVNGIDRIDSQFWAYTAVGFQTWDFKTKINGVLFQKGAATTDDSGDLKLGVNRAVAGLPTVASLTVDATNRTTGERCFLTVGVPPVDQPNAVDLKPWDAQGICSQGTPWKLRVQHHVRANGQEKVAIGLRVIAGTGGQQWDTRATFNDEEASSGSGFAQDGIVQGGAAVIWRPGTQPIDIQTAGVWAKNVVTGEICKVDAMVPPLG